MPEMRTWKSLALVIATLLPACAVPRSMEVLPTLFPVEGQYELVNPRGEVTGYVYAVTQEPGKQLLRWVLLDNFVQPRIQPVSIRRAVGSSAEPALPATASEFADFARDKVAAGSNVVYAKSHADTFCTLTEAARKIVAVPIPIGRRPPDPPGAAMAESKSTGKYQEIDDGTVGIKRGSPPGELPPGNGGSPSLGGGGGGGGYYDSTQADPAGILGMVVSSPPYEEEHENWFIPDMLFQSGLDGTTLLPFANQASAVTDAPSSQWVVVVVNSSYYPGFVPNDW
jgi:hypothetical protein